MTDFGYVPGKKMDDALRTAEDQMVRMRELRERMADVVGQGEAADGRITAEFRQEGGLTALDLDPRVLRLPSAELSLEIRAAVNAAAQDFQTKVTQAGGELFGGAEDAAARLAEPKAALAQMEKLGNDFAVQMKDVLRELTTQQQRAKGAVQEIRGPRQSY